MVPLHLRRKGQKRHQRHGTSYAAKPNSYPRHSVRTAANSCKPSGGPRRLVRL